MLRIAHERRRRGWSQVQVTLKTGIDPGNLSKLELGKLYPYPGWKQKLAEAFGIPGDELFQEVPEDAGEAADRRTGCSAAAGHRA